MCSQPASGLPQEPAAFIPAQEPAASFTKLHKVVPCSAASPEELCFSHHCVNASEPSSSALETSHRGKANISQPWFYPGGRKAQLAAGHVAGRHSSLAEENTIPGCEVLLDLDRQGNRIPFPRGSSTARAQHRQHRDPGTPWQLLGLT